MIRYVLARDEGHALTFNLVTFSTVGQAQIELEHKRSWALFGGWWDGFAVFELDITAKRIDPKEGKSNG